MAVIFKIDDNTKNKMVAAYDVYRIKQKGIYVQNSYKLNDYNVYSLSNFLHIGIKKTGDEVEQIILDVPNSTLVESLLAYNEHINLMIEKNTSRSKDLFDKKFKHMQSKINSAIDEYINRNKIYENYLSVKKRQIELIKEDIEKRIAEEEEKLRRIISRRVKFSRHYSGLTSPEFDIVLRSYVNTNGRTHIEWSIARTPNNLEILLDNLDYIVGDDSHLSSLYTFLLIISYYTSDKMFEDLFINTERVQNDSSMSDMIFNILSNEIDSYATSRPFRDRYVIDGLIRQMNLSQFNYDLINKREHLQRILDMYYLIVDAHKQYVEISIREIEKCFFGLDNSLAGSKATKVVLGQLLQIERLKNKLLTDHTLI